MHFLILADNYYPLPLANSICLRSYVEGFKAKGHKCTIINRVDDGIKVEDTEGIYSFNCSRRPKYKSPFNTLYKIAQLFVYPHVYKRLVNCYYEQIKKLDLSNVDVIFSICNPIESVLAALKVKETHPNIRQIVYNVDTLSDFRIRWIECVFCPFWRKKAHTVEVFIYENVDLALFLSSHKEFYSASKYSEYKNKFMFQEVPLLQVNDEKYCKDNGRSIYAGRFYKDFREPKILLNLFKNTSLGIDVYTTSNFCRIISKSGISSNISVNEYIPEDELNKIMKESKILVSIGNKSSNMFPSKTVSYVAMCKPIIHIFHDDIDPVVDYLKDYPDVLFVDLRNSLAKNRALVLDFCTREHKPIDATEIEKRYITSTPEYCSKEVLVRIKKLAQ